MQHIPDKEADIVEWHSYVVAQLHGIELTRERIHETIDPLLKIQGMGSEDILYWSARIHRYHTKGA